MLGRPAGSALKEKLPVDNGGLLMDTLPSGVIVATTAES